MAIPCKLHDGPRCGQSASQRYVASLIRDIVLAALTEGCSDIGEAAYWRKRMQVETVIQVAAEHRQVLPRYLADDDSLADLFEKVSLLMEQLALLV